MTVPSSQSTTVLSTILFTSTDSNLLGSMQWQTVQQRSAPVSATIMPPNHSGAGALAMDMLTLVSPVIVVALFFLCLLRIIFRCCRSRILARLKRRTNVSASEHNVNGATSGPNGATRVMARHGYMDHGITDIEVGDDALYTPNNHFMIRTIRVHPSDYFFYPQGMPPSMLYGGNGFPDDSMLEEPFPPKYEDAIKLPAPTPRPSGSPARSSNCSRASQVHPPRTVPPPPLYDQTAENWETAQQQQQQSSSSSFVARDERRPSCMTIVESRQEEEEPPAYSVVTVPSHQEALSTISDRVSLPLTPAAQPKQIPEFVKKFTRGRLSSIDSAFQDPRKSTVPSPMGSMVQLGEGRVQSTTSLATTIETFINPDQDIGELMSEFGTPRATLGSHQSLAQSFSDSTTYNSGTQEVREQSRRVPTASLQTFVPKLGGQRVQQQKQQHQLLRPRITLASMGTASGQDLQEHALIVESESERPQSSLSSLCPLDVPYHTSRPHE